MDKEILELLKLAGIGHKPVAYSNVEGEDSPFTLNTIEDDVEEDFLKQPPGEKEMYDDDDYVEENAFNTARDKAIAAGKDSFEFEGETYPVTDVDPSDIERAQKRFDEEEENLSALWNQFQQVAIETYPDVDPVESMMDRYDVDMDILTAAANEHGYDHPMDWVDELYDNPTEGPRMLEDEDDVVYDPKDELELEESAESSIDRKIKTIFGKIHGYGDDALDYLDDNAPLYDKLATEHYGDLDAILANATDGQKKVLYKEIESVLDAVKYLRESADTVVDLEGPGEPEAGDDITLPDGEEGSIIDIEPVDDIMIKFESEEAHDLIDELFGAIAERGIEGEIILPPRVRGAVEDALADFEEGSDYSFVDPMNEVDLQNGYDDGYCVDPDDYFPSGATGPAPKRLGPGAAKHGDNPLATSITIKESTDLFEKYQQKYKKFKAENTK